MIRRTLARVLPALALAWATAPALAQDVYPTRPIRIIVSVPPGGSLDITTRLVAEKMRERLGQPVIVENRPGADSVLASRLVKDTPADGYTILSTHNGFSNQPVLKLNPGYDPIADFTALGPMVRGPLVVETSSELPDRTLKDWIARARSSKLSYASAGVGSPLHFAAEMMFSKLGLSLLHVPYKGAAAAYPDVATGRVDLFFDGYAGSAAFLKSGKFRPLAVTGPTRLPTLPDVPTLQELGVDLTYQYWLGLLVKAGTPRDVVQKLSDALKHATSSKELVERFAADGVDASFMTPAEFGDFIAKEIVASTKLAADLKLPKE